MNILLSSAGAKIPLLKALKNAARRIDMCATVIAGDSDNGCISRYLADNFWQMPETSDNNLADILRGCETRKITHILPSRDGELLFYAKHRAAFEDAGIQVMCAPYDAIRRCVDKLLFSQSAPFAIPTSEAISDIDSTRFAIKTRFGAGSDSILLNVGEEEARVFARALSSPVFQPYIAGKEISVDAWLDSTGHVKGHICRYRELIVQGESQVTCTVSLPQFDQQIVQCLETLGLTGPVVLQALVTPDDRLHIIECNSRFGGASTLGLIAGVDSLFWGLLESLGEDLSSHTFVPASEPIRQVRHAADSYQ